MRISLVILILILGIEVLAQNPIEKEGWDLTFNDEFNDGKLNYEKWQDHHYWGGRYTENTGMTYYGKDQFQFSDSSIIIIADDKENEGNRPYRSGMIDGNLYFKQLHGYFEIRSKNPKGTGFWPAFWLASTEDWPPEVDVYEFFTNEPRRIKTNHHWKKSKKAKKQMKPKGYTMKTDAADDFHTYAIDWSKKKIRWYYDNKRIKTSRRGLKYYIYEMHVIINCAVHNINDMKPKEAIFPGHFEVDYVRVYQKKPQP